jgi:NIMA (never in mitosis gene a)-related kinase
MTSDKIIKIGDFGVSRVLEKTVMNARTVVGSPYYLSPEIIENKPYSFQTDIWSLGALLYEMCALSPPFVANNLQFLALKIVKGTYGQIPSHYSSDLKSLIKSMLNTDSSKRPNINKILTSKVISKRIASFLTESKRID